MRFNMTNKIFSVVYLIATLLSACGGGGGGGSTSAPANFTVSVTVSGLTGSVVLQNNGGDNLSFNSNTTTAFSTKIASGYNVTVLTQPITGQTCTPVNGSGTTSANITVTVNCNKNTIPRYAYTANVSDNSVSTYVVDSTTGRLKFIGKTAIANAKSLTVDPSGKHVYVVDGANVLQFSINANGSLTPIGTGTIATGTNPTSITIDPLGRFAYVTDSGDVSAYSINMDGSLSIVIGSPFSTGTTPQSVTVDPSGKYAYVANSGDVSAYSINAMTGALTLNGSVQITNPLFVAIDSSSHAYVLNSSGVSQYTIDPNGMLINPQAAIAAGTNPQSITLSGSYAYVANQSSNDVSAYTINSMTGAFLPISGSPFSAGTTPKSVSVDPSGTRVYVANAGINGTVAASISQFSIDTTVATSGALIPLSPASAVGLAGATSISIAAGNSTQTVQALPQNAFVANYNSGTISQYKIDATNGTLPTSATVTRSAGTRPISISADPSGKYVYVANEGDSISQYTFDTAGILSPPITTPVTTNTTPYAIAVDPSGQYAYIVNAGTASISQYTIVNGALNPMNPPTVSVGISPQAISIDPSGKYVYVAKKSTFSPPPKSTLLNDGSVSQFTIGVNGVLTFNSVTSSAGSPNPSSVSTDPTGRYVYVTNFGGGISQYAIGANGVLSQIGNGAGTGISPTSVTTDPSGKYVYVANNGGSIQNNGSLSQYTSTLTSLIPGTVGTGKPYSVTVDPSGKYLYAVGATITSGIASYYAQQYKIDATGALSASGTPVTTGSSPVCVITTGTWQ